MTYVVYYSIKNSRFFFFFSLNAFINIGNRLSRVLDRISKSNDHQQMSQNDFQSIDLHQHYDRLFLNEYIRIHHIPHVTLNNSNLFLFSCCPCSHDD
jgi:hypothetical protein